ncbi:TolC family protein [candidate division KSB1 bacterium]|nr:TolC family protein [candidate division KSB1 bacterium]RQW02858.1 MAG: TolC family protein [candidate division KSB1 bacterium]
MFRKIMTILIFAAAVLPAQEVLERYIQQALDSNLSLKQADFSYEKSLASLREARGMFLPAVGIEARYSRADGGRIIEFPIGDLLNPIYQTLNALTGVPQFPTNLPNESFRFFREREHDTKVRVVQPVFQPHIYYNYKIQKNVAEIERASRDAYARHVVAEVKTAYYNYLTAIQIVELANRTKALLDENVRVSESLYENQKATIDVVYRARAELSRLQQRQVEANKLYELSRAYFNFLLNRSLDTPIDVEDVRIPERRQPAALNQVEESALQNREELLQLRAAIDAQRNGVNLNRASFLPGLAVVFDYGYQGEEYIFNSDYDYWMASAVLSWSLFKGGQDKAKIQQALLEQARLETQRMELKKQIQLDVRTAYEDLRVVNESIDAALEELTSAGKNYQIVSKKYEQGMAPHIEFLDAQNTYTQAELNAIIVNYDYFIKSAQLEKAAATFSLQTND